MTIDENQKLLLFLITQLLKQAEKNGTSEETLKLANGENYNIKVEFWKRN